MEHIARNDAFALLKKYNKDPFHIQHALTVEAVMKWYANELGYGRMLNTGVSWDCFTISTSNYILPSIVLRLRNC